MLKQKNHSALSYLRESLPAISFSLILFMASGLVAFLAPQFFTFLDPIIRELGNSIEGKNFIEIALFIFQNNITSAFFGLMLGSLLGIIPIVNSLVNGSLVGYVLARATEVEGLSIAWRLLPHGIFELPAIFISLGMGIRLGMSLFSANPVELFKHRFELSVRAFILIVVPLLIAAAFIEGALIYFVK